jgi:hypothetical protein
MRASFPLYRSKSCFRVWGCGEGLDHDKPFIPGEANFTRESGAGKELI